MAASDIPLARQALAALRRGREPDRLQSEALARVDRLANASRPLAAYAPRTQRRYLAAAAAGSDAHVANQIEYQKARNRNRDRTGGRPVSMRTIVQRAANRNARLLGTDETRDLFSRDQIDHLITLVGLDGALFILESQKEAIDAYRAGDPSVGRDRWDDKFNIIERYIGDEGFPEYVVPYFFYRARK